MYQDLYYVANADDEAAFRAAIEDLKLHVLPCRPDGPRGLTASELVTNPKRLLSLRPVEQVQVSYTDPYPHFSPAAQPLIEWEPPQTKEKVLIAAHLRHHPYMLKKGPEYAAIGKAFTQIKAWLKANWQPINQFDFMGPGAARLINEHGYSWSPVDPAHTTVETIQADGMTQELTYDEWIKSDEDRKA